MFDQAREKLETYIMIFLVAGNYAEAVVYAKEQGWSISNNQNWRYVWKFEHIAGQFGAEIIKVKNHWNNDLYKSVESQRYLEMLEGQYVLQKHDAG